jgi:hypothetical protein
MAVKNAVSPIAEMILMVSDSARKAVESSTHCRKPNATLPTPAMSVPQRKRLRDPMLSMYLPKNGEQMMVVKKTLP